MIKNKEFVQTCLHQLQSLSLGERLSFKTLKKDREIVVSKTQVGSYRTEENGFEYRNFEVKSEIDLKKILKTLPKIEFPRSNQIWFKIKKSRQKFD